MDTEQEKDLEDIKTVLFEFKERTACEDFKNKASFSETVEFYSRVLE